MEDCNNVASGSNLEAYVIDHIEMINRQSTSFSLGVQVISGCNEIEIRAQLMKEISRQIPICCNEEICEGSTQNSTLIGVIGADIKEYKQLTISLPYITIGEIDNIPATSDYLSEDLTTTNIFHAGVDKQQRAKAAADLAQTLNWDYTTVVHGGDELSESLISKLTSELNHNHICIDSFIELSGNNNLVDLSSADKPRGIILVGTSNNMNVTRRMDDNITWIVTTNKPWKKANLLTNPEDTVYVITPQQNITNQLSLVLSLGYKAYESVVNTSCPDNYTRCKEIPNEQLQKQMSEAFDKVQTRTNQVTSRFEQHRLVEDPEQPLFELHDRQGNLAGTYSNSTGWSLQPAIQIDENSNQFWCTNSECQKKCIEQITPNNYIFVPGDYIIVFTTPVHDTFSNAWSCTKFNREFTLRAEAALFARERLSTLLDMNFGVLILDTCFSIALTQTIIADILSLNGTKSYCANGHCLDRSKVIGLIGDYSSHIAVTEQQMVIPANLLQVSYGSATNKLDDKEMYTNFLRVHASNTRVTTNVVQLLKNLSYSGPEINSVVLISTDTEYGTNGAEQLKIKLKENNFCILENFTLHNDAQDDDEDEIKKRDRIWSMLQVYDTHSLVIICNGEDKAIKDLLRHLNSSEETRNWWKKSGSIFIFTEVWENRQSLLDDFGDLTRGSISLKFNALFEVPEFQKRLMNFFPKASRSNPWIIKRFQQEQHCKLRGDFSYEEVNSTVVGCGSKRLTMDDIVLDIYTINMIKAMYTFGYGFHNYSVSVCGKGNSCDQLYSRTKASANALKKKMSEIEIPRSDSIDIADLKPFDQNLDGNGGYEVYSQQYTKVNHGKLVYVLVYTFTKNYTGSADTIDIPDPTKIVEFYKADNNGEDTVQKVFQGKHCEPGKCKQTCEQEVSPPPTSSPNLPLIFLSVCLSLAIVTITLLAVVICYFCKRRRLALSTLSRKKHTNNNMDCNGNNGNSNIQEDCIDIHPLPELVPPLDSEPNSPRTMRIPPKGWLHVAAGDRVAVNSGYPSSGLTISPILRRQIGSVRSSTRTQGEYSRSHVNADVQQEDVNVVA